MTPYSDTNGKLGTCVRRNDNNGASWLAVQTGSSSFTRYMEIDTTAWYHIALIGRYSAADAYTDMYVYKYNGSKAEFVAKYEKVNQRNLSAGKEKGADHINVHKGTSVDNVRVTALGADALTLTSDSDTLKGGDTMTFTAGATRCGLPITTPSLTWSIYNEANTAAEDDNELTLSDGNLTASLYAAAKTVNVRIDSDKLTAAKAITIDAVSVTDLPFDTLTLSAAKAYVSADEPLTISASASKKGSAVTLGEDDLIWYVCESSGLVKLGDDLKWIKINNGVMTVDRKAVTQDVVVVAADTSDTVRASINVHIKASDAIESGDGTIDKLVLADNCEAELANATLSAGAPDGTHYLTTVSGYRTASITETASDVVFEMDMRFNAEGAGFNPGAGGKVNTCVKYHNGDICIQTGGSSYTKVLTGVSTEDWYHITLITKPGAYAHIIIDKYNSDGTRERAASLQNVGRRNDRNNAYIEMYENTSYDNVRVLAPVPNGISITTDAKTVFAGSSVTASAALSWNGLEMKDPAAGQIVYAVYDGENASPAGDSFTVSDDGAIEVSAMAPAGDYYIRAISPQAEIYDSAKLTVVSSDIFTVTKLGINEAGTEAVKLYVDKNFYYADEVTFVAAIYSADGAMKDAAIKSVSGATLKSGEENEVSISLSLAGFDKYSDIIKVFPVTRLSTDEANETDETFKASVSGNDITITAVPAFTDKVLVLALGSGSDETDVAAADIVYIGVKNSINAEDVLKANAGAEIVKAAGIYGGAQKIFSAVLSK